MREDVLMSKALGVVLLLSGLVMAGCATVPNPSAPADTFVIFDYVPMEDEFTHGYATMVSAHRGGAMPEQPLIHSETGTAYAENSLVTMESHRAVIEATSMRNMPRLLFEIDVMALADGNLILMHDRTLDRTTNATGAVADLTLDDLRDVRLRANDGSITSEPVPLLAEALRWAVEREQFLFLDRKNGLPYEILLAEVERYDAMDWAIFIAYTPEDVAELGALDPRIFISAPGGSVDTVEAVLATGVSTDRMIFFIGTREPNAEVITRLHSLGRMVIFGAQSRFDTQVLPDADVTGIYLPLSAARVDVIGTDLPILVAYWIATMRSVDRDESIFR